MESSINTKGEDEYKIKIGMTSEEIEWRIAEVLKDIPEAVGMNNHQGSSATADGKVMSVVASVLKRNNKYFVDSRTTGKTVAEKIMREIGVPTARRHVFLDNDDFVTIKNKEIIGIDSLKVGSIKNISFEKNHFIVHAVSGKTIIF